MTMTKQVLIWLFTVTFVMVAVQPTLAVDKKKKEETAKTKVEQKKDQEAKSKTEAKKDSSAKASKGKTDAKKSTKEFNSFIDKNKNGIDDRRENIRTKQVAKSDPKTDNGKEKKDSKTKPSVKKDTVSSSKKKSDKKKK